MRRKILLWISLGIVLAIVPIASAQTIAACGDKMVCDQTGFLSVDQIRRLTEYHLILLERYDVDLKVVVATNVGDIAMRSISLFKEMRVGEKSSSRKGVLLLIDPAQDKVRMEISAGLDAVYTDGFVSYLQQRQMVPFFTAGRVADGVLATTELIVDRAQKAAMKQEFVPPAELPKNLAVGAGAQTTASIGRGYQRPSLDSANNAASSGLSPKQVVDAYHQALAQGNASPDLSIYSRATQQLKRSWVVTPAQMSMEYSTYRNCQVDKVIENGQTAFVRYGVRQRLCAPYFLVKEDGEWKLDFAAMMQNIRFNVDNQWHFDMNKASRSVLSAFSDWEFDKNGYPH